MAMLDDARAEGFRIEECTDGCDAGCAACPRTCPETHPVLYRTGEEGEPGEAYCSLPCLGKANGGNFY